MKNNIVTREYKGVFNTSNLRYELDCGQGKGVWGIGW